MTYKGQQLQFYNQAKENDGGVIRFIDILDKYHYDYRLHCRKDSKQVTIYIDVNGNHFRVSDRKIAKAVRITVPKAHFLSKNYKNYNGFLKDESLGLDPEVVEVKNSIYVFFRPEDFEGVIKEIYKKD